MANDPWHFLVCPTQNKREISSRHNAVVHALYRAVLLTGGQAKREVTALQADSGLRPDLQLVYPGRHVLTDVAVAHPLSAYGRSRPNHPTACAKSVQAAKRTKYSAIASRHDAELIPFVVETCGGLGRTPSPCSTSSAARHQHTCLSGRKRMRPGRYCIQWPSLFRKATP